MAEEATMVRINHVYDLPGLFQLNKYQPATKLDTAGWYEQLLLRYNLQKSFNRIQGNQTNEYDEELDTDIFDHVCIVGRNDFTFANANIISSTPILLNRNVSVPRNTSS
jgi:hypothetical protein